MSVRVPFLLAVALMAILSACGTREASPTASLVGEADVERFRLEVFRETSTLDADIAQVETEAAMSDSVRQAAYGPVLERLRQDRLRLQTRVDSLKPLPQVAFDSTTASIEGQIARLRASVGRARFDASSDVESLRAALAARLARFDARLADASAQAVADTTGRRTRDLDSLAADRGRLDARLVAFADTTEPAFVRLRQTTAATALQLEGRLNRLAPDSTRVQR